MARRNRGLDSFEVIGQLAFLLALLSLISPTVRHILQALPGLMMIAVGMMLIGLILFIAYRFFIKSRQRQPSEGPVESGSSDLKELPATIQRPHHNLRERLHSIDWFQFEKLISLAYRHQGFIVQRMGGAQADGGVDLIIEKDGCKTVIQCKHWKGWNVGVRHVRELLGTLKDTGISKAVLVTLRGYTDEARELALKHDVQLLDENGVLKLIEQAGGQGNPEIQRFLDDDRKYCPKCGSEMVVRTAARGLNKGGQFWGCKAYPRCKFILR